MFGLDQRTIFAFDGVGAVVTAFCVGVLLPIFHDYIGMPVDKLYAMGALGVVFACYSFSIFFFSNHDRDWYLPVIMNLNLAYCLITAVFLWVYFDQIQLLGWIYFVGEIVIVVALVGVEYVIWKRGSYAA